VRKPFTARTGRIKLSLKLGGELVAMTPQREPDDQKPRLVHRTRLQAFVINTSNRDKELGARRKELRIHAIAPYDTDEEATRWSTSLQ
jgi:hypothetical protein